MGRPAQPAAPARERPRIYGAGSADARRIVLGYVTQHERARLHREIDRQIARAAERRPRARARAWGAGS
jgi:hypothetical protein